MHIGIKPRRMCSFEFFQEGLFVAATPDVIANVIRIRQGENDQVMTRSFAKRAGAGCLGLFMLGLAMNDGGR